MNSYYMNTKIFKLITESSRTKDLYINFGDNENKFPINLSVYEFTTVDV